MNCIACAAPKNRTILIIREITNLERQSLHECLRSMEKLKEHRVAFPIVLETSNFLWFDLPSVKNPGYHLNPMLSAACHLMKGRKN